MIQRGHGAHFAREAVAEALGGNLDGDIAGHAGIVGAVDFTHAAGTDGYQDLIGPQASSNCKSHGR
jgi:hypothetical protein